MKIHGTAKGGALSTKDFGVAFSGNGNGALSISLDDDAGWVDDGSGDFEWSSGKLDFDPIKRAKAIEGGAQFIYLDFSAAGLLGENLSADQWTVRLGKLTTTTFAASGSGSPILYVCISNNTDNSGTDQDTFAIELDYSSDFGGNNVTKATDSQTLEEGGVAKADFTTTNSSSYEYYIEFKKTAESGSNNLTVSIFPTSAYETATESLSVTASIADLKYIKFINNSEQTQVREGGAELTGTIQIFNGSNP